MEEHRRTPLYFLLAFVLLAIILGASPTCSADAGVFTGGGQNLRQITSKNIQLVTINVAIVPGRGRFLFDGSVPGMDEADYLCRFVLRSLSEQAEDVEVGFPVDSEFAQNAGRTTAKSSRGESVDWVLSYSFIARDESRTYHVEFVHRKRSGAPDDFGELFTWKMHFAPQETRTLTVQYHIPMSMALATTQKDEMAEFPPSGLLDQGMLNEAIVEVASYISSTGSSWAGHVESATFTVVTEPFERYLNSRGWMEDSGAEMTPQQEAKFREFQELFPVAHPWWFRQISPAGWKKVNHGIQWTYKDYKPRDTIELRYYMTHLPRLPEEVDPFVDQFLKSIGTGTPAFVALNQLKQLLLATYGEEPVDAAVKKHAASQLWYAPQKDFSLHNLSKRQDAVLKKIDARIAAVSPP